MTNYKRNKTYSKNLERREKLLLKALRIHLPLELLCLWTYPNYESGRRYL